MHRQDSLPVHAVKRHRVFLHLGFPKDQKGNICGSLTEVPLEMDPTTKLYGGKYTGFHFDEMGQLFGEATMTDPVTGQTCTTQDFLIQVTLCGLPGALRSCPPESTLLRSSEKACLGVAGQGALGQVCPGSLELSNVDFTAAGPAFRMQIDRRATLARTESPMTPDDIRTELETRLQWDPRLLEACLNNVRLELVPGFQTANILEALSENRPARIRQQQGELVETHNPYHLAIQGRGYFLLSDGSLTRGGNFVPTSSGLVALKAGQETRPDEVRLLMGYPGRSQSPTEKLEPMVLPPDSSNLEIGPDGEIRITTFAGDGNPEVVGRVALASWNVRSSSVKTGSSCCLARPADRSELASRVQQS